MLLYTVWPWSRDFEHKDTILNVLDQCRVGLKGATGRPVKKPTMILRNAIELAEPFARLKCNCPPGSHEQTWGAPGGIGKLQIWNYKMPSDGYYVSGLLGAFELARASCPALL